MKFSLIMIAPPLGLKIKMIYLTTYRSTVCIYIYVVNWSCNYSAMESNGDQLCFSYMFPVCPASDILLPYRMLHIFIHDHSPHSRFRQHIDVY